MECIQMLIDLCLETNAVEVAQDDTTTRKLSDGLLGIE